VPLIHTLRGVVYGFRLCVIQVQTAHRASRASKSCPQIFPMRCDSDASELEHVGTSNFEVSDVVVFEQMSEIQEAISRMKILKNKVFGLVAALTIASSVTVAAAPTARDQEAFTPQMMKKVRSELVTLPYYGVFDNLAFQINGNVVTLSGQVTRPTTRKDAERRVRKIAGVGRVVNNIEVLPLSSFDDTIRVRTYRAVFRASSLYRYALGANPSIHIVVNRGRVTLEGVVANKMDSQLAYMAARGVPGVFAVKNNLRVQGES
jgi:hyperosmotically inducible periplasmic protein